MGTNYYWHPKPRCPTCNRCDEPVHIGKSSMGWTFSLHVGQWVDLGDEEIRISGLDDWKRLFAVPGSFIEDEYKEVVSADEMLETITERKAREGHVLSRQSDYDHKHTVPGPGTYDLTECDFR